MATARLFLGGGDSVSSVVEAKPPRSRIGGSNPKQRLRLIVSPFKVILTLLSRGAARVNPTSSSFTVFNETADSVVLYPLYLPSRVVASVLVAKEYELFQQLKRPVESGVKLA